MLTRWEPFGGLRQRRRENIFSQLDSMRQEINRIFDDFFGENQPRMTAEKWFPAVDVSENDSEVVVQAELPGMTKDDIELNIEENVLTLQGEKKQETKDEQENYRTVERSYGKFRRVLTLPATIDPDKVEARFKDGVLKVTMPKTEEAKPKKIAISAGA